MLLVALGVLPLMVVSVASGATLLATPVDVYKRQAVPRPHRRLRSRGYVCGIFVTLAVFGGIGVAGKLKVSTGSGAAGLKSGTSLVWYLRLSLIHI